jgi:hypothetical protein
MDNNTDVGAAMPGLRRAFDSLKAQLRDGPSDSAAAKVFGVARMFGDELKEVVRRESQPQLQRRDPLTRFFVLRLRGMDQPPDVASMSSDFVFLSAFTIFSYVEPVMEETTIGDHVGFDEDGNWIVQRRLADNDDGTLRAIQAKDGGWSFDLMPIYMTKAMSLADYIRRDFDGDFDAFFARYLADHDVALNLEQAWVPAAE